MPKVPISADLSPARLDGHMRNPAQLDRSAIAALGSARSKIGDSIAALGSAFGEVAARAGAAQDNQNAANAKLEWLKGDVAIGQDVGANVGEDGELYKSVPQRYGELNKSIDEKYPISDPAKRQNFQMWREQQTFQRGIEAARSYQGSQRGMFMRGFESDLTGIEGRIAKGEIDPSRFGEVHGALNEKLDGMDRYVLSRADVEAKKREINARLMGAFDQFLQTDPDARQSFWDQVAKGKYEVDQPGYGQPAQPQQGGQPRAAVQGLGSVSAKYESGGRGVGFISTGKDDPGGQSYGIHQLSGAYSMGAFLRSSEGAKYREQFGNSRPMTAEFNAAYRRVAQQDPQGFAEAQRAFYTRTHYEPVRSHAEQLGFDVNNRGVQEALFSMGVQHGKARDIVSRAAAAGGAKGSVEQQIQALYQQRSRYVSGLRNLPANTKQSVLNRYRNEVRDALGMAGESGGQEPIRVASLLTASDATVSEDVPSSQQAEFGRLAALAQENADVPVSEALSKEEVAAIKQQVVGSGAIEAQEFDSMLQQGITVGEAAGIVEGSMEGSGLDAETAARMFAQQEPEQRRGAMTAPAEAFPMGRLTGGQTFRVKTSRGEFSFPAEMLNDVTPEMRKKLAAASREAATIAQKDREILADGMMKDQEEHVEQFGSDAPDYDVAGIRAAYRKNPKVVEKHLRKVEASKQVAEMMKDAPKLREEDLDRRLAQLRPKEGSHHIAEQQEVYEKAEKRVEKMLEQRRNDPASAVAGTPQVKGVTEKLENGQPKNQAEAFQLVNARLNSQRLLGIAPQNQRPLTNAEAKRLAQPLMNVDEGRAEEALQQVNEKVVKAFGHKYSGIIMRQVTDHAFSDKARKDSLFSILRGMDEEGRVAPTDMERAREMYRVRNMEKAIEGPAGDRPPTASEQIGTGIFPGTFGQLRKRIEFFGQVLGGGPSPQQQEVPAKREVVPARKAPPAAIEHLRQNPTLAPQFEQRYGTGTARQYLLK